MPLGLPRPRVSHAHPLTADARASRAAVAFRAAERAAARAETERRRRGPRRVAIPATAALAIAAALLLAGQPLSPAPLPASALGDRSDIDSRAALTATSETSATAQPTAGPTVRPPLVAGPVGRPQVDDPVALSSGYVWPVEHARITQRFGPSSGGLFVVDGQRFHDGIDIANFCGAPILAAHAGTVLAAGRSVAWLGWSGHLDAYVAYLTAKHLWGTQARVIVIDDGNGLRSVYIHLHRLDVTVGQVVKAGQQIGLEGSSGHATGCHLHYSVYDPSDPGRWATNQKDIDRYHLPTDEIPRLDPLTLLPPLSAGWITWGWGTQPTD